MTYWFEEEEGKQILSLENAAILEKFPGTNPKPVFVDIEGEKHFGYQCTLTTNFEGLIKKLRVFVVYNNDYITNFDIKVFPLEVLDKNDHPTGEVLKTQVSFHRYSDGHLCLFYAPAVNPRKFSIVTILTWASTWWWCYNYKKKYGSWPAHEK